ncbi:MAG: ribonuclease P protein component [Firmicutes bacterium]|nr:ribonuclease P protein component [Bacillota bacterium]
MLAKKYRLKKRKTFTYIYKRGKSCGADCLTLVFVPCKMKDTPIRVGFSASKKVGNSVKRHRASRMMREAIKVLLPRMKPDHNYIFVAKEEILKKSLDEITKACEKVLAKHGLLSPN